MISIERTQEAIKASKACKDRSPEVILELMTDRESFQYLVLHKPELLTVLYCTASFKMKEFNESLSVKLEEFSI